MIFKQITLKSSMNNLNTMKPSKTKCETNEKRRNLKMEMFNKISTHNVRR